MSKLALPLLLLGGVACDPNVVDAVREPAPVVEPGPMSPLQTSLIHRYSFEGDGGEALDSQFSAHGQIIGSSLAGSGSLVLAGTKGTEYVNLPNGIMRDLTSATFEAWLTWRGAGPWQRIFDFGSSYGGEDPALTMPGGGTYSGKSYLFLTPTGGTDTSRKITPGLRVAYSLDGVSDETACFSNEPFPKDSEHHVAVVVNAPEETFTLYLDGALVVECPLLRSLSAIDNNNNYLGRSNFTADVDLEADYDEFRIYRAALTAHEIADSYKAGPDAKP